MHIPNLDRTLLRSLLAGAVVLASTSACSRPDRPDAGSEANQPAAAQPADTQTTAATATADTGSPATTTDTGVSQRTRTTGTDQGVAGYQPMSRDTLQRDTGAQTRASKQTDTVTVGDSARIGKPGERLEGNQTSEQANQDTLEDQSDADRIRPPEDSSEISGAAVGSTQMARDTSVEVAQGDTAIQAEAETPGTVEADTDAVAVEVDTSTTAQAPPADTSAVEVRLDTTMTAHTTEAEDTAAIQVSVDTTSADQPEVAVETQAAVDTSVADTAVAVGDSTEAGKVGERLEPEVATAEANADTLQTDADRIRPPEDSTEVLGNVTTEDDKADTEEVESADAVAAAAAGIPSTGNAITGANAVAKITRQGQGCVATGSEDVRWDMSISPATLNPCGTGTMTLPKVVTGE